MEIEITAMAVAQAIRSTGKFGKAEHEAAMDYITAECEDKDDMRAGLSRLGNVSAVRQELEKAGVIKGNHSDSVFVLHVKKAITLLDAKK
jgi:hypothetical protein